MTSFWLAVVALFIMAGGLIFWPLIQFKLQQRKTGDLEITPSDAQRQRNVEIFKERLSELEAERVQGNLDNLAFEQLKLELEKSLLNDVTLVAPDLNQREIILGTQHWLSAGIMTLAVILGSLTLYTLYGRSDDYLRYEVMKAQGLFTTKTSPDGTASQGLDLNKAIEIIKAKIEQDPKDVQKWFLLAKSYAATNQYAKAAEAFLEITKLTPKDSPEYAMVKGSYAQALYLANNEQISPEIQAVVEETLAIDPKEANALILKGVAAFQSEQYQQAIDIWSAAKQNAGQSLIDEFINPAIQSAQERLGIATAPKNAVAQPPAPSDKSVSSTAKIEVLVDIAPELKASVSPDQVVFVFARPPESKMPLAAERLAVKDLPATIILDDSKAAMPTAKLSSVPTVDVTARISLSGQVVPQPGDLFVTQSEVRVDGNESIKLMINQVVGE